MLSSADSLDLFRLVVERAPDGTVFISRLTVSQMSLMETTDSPQQRGQ
jgi:hypothetical protein